LKYRLDIIRGQTIFRSKMMENIILLLSKYAEWKNE